MAVWLVGNGRAGALGLAKVPEMGLRGHDASWLPCVVALCTLPMVGEGASSCHLKSGGMVPPSIGNACPGLAHRCTAMTPFMSARVVAGRIGDVAQVSVLTASQ